MSETASVEVLRAEVRVMMVGSRQVTLSVFRQLDWVDWGRIEPFGRINDGERERFIIGRDKKSGVLVRGNFSDRWYGFPRWSDDDENRLKQLRYDVEQRRKSLGELKSGKESFWPQNPEWRLKRQQELPEEIRALEQRIEDRQAEKASVPGEQERYRAEVAAFQALPLIVLAGLK